ncbi:hypothetical protein [Paraburkholderia sp.]|uniref:hypothetical protein n=1 Tax=Paraburkholderia sp. TaxID=1926495 RepID=UPI003C7AB623
MKYIKGLAIAVLVVGVAIFGVKYIVGHWFYEPQPIYGCIDDHGYITRMQPEQHTRYLTCVKAHATLFLDRDYAESKDLAKTFLTLLSAILVASITFSEKIVDVNNAELAPMSLMVLCWLLLLISIVACGTGLAFFVTGAGIAAYSPELDYREQETSGVILFLASGVIFGCALISLIAAGVTSLLGKRVKSKLTAAVVVTGREGR